MPRRCGSAVAILVMAVAMVNQLGCQSQVAMRFQQVEAGKASLSNQGREALLEEAGVRIVLVRDYIDMQWGESIPGNQTLEVRLVNESGKPLCLDSDSVLLYRVPAYFEPSPSMPKALGEWFWPEESSGVGTILAPGKSAARKFILMFGDQFQYQWWILCRFQAPPVEAKILLGPDSATKRLVPMGLFYSYRPPPYRRAPPWARAGFP